MGKHKKPPFRVARTCHCGEHGFVGLTVGLVSFISPSDVHRASQFNWCVIKGGYARSYGRETGFMLRHRFLTSPSDDQVVDHIDRSPLNNQRHNLRVCSQKINMWNTKACARTSSFKGVHKGGDGKWVAQICTEGKRSTIGRFESENEAAEAYDVAAIRSRGSATATNESLKLLNEGRT